MRRTLPGFPFLDVLLATLVAVVLLLALTLIAARTSTAPPTLQTPGMYVIEATWSGEVDEDVDLYVQTPSRYVVFYVNRTVGLTHLEHDDLGFPSATIATGRRVKVAENDERTVIRGIDTGHYGVTVHLFRRGVKEKPVPVRITLWRLIGEDRALLTARVVLSNEGDERTAFRFTLKNDGSVGEFNRLPLNLVREAVAGQQVSPADSSPRVPPS